MSGTVRTDPRAALEFEQAALWYDQRQPGLGRDLVAEVRSVIDHLAQFPGAGSPVERTDPALDIRRLPVRRFPYQVVYVTTGEDVVVIAVAHERRRSQYWADRIDEPST